ATYHGPSAKDPGAVTLEALTPAWVTSIDGKKVVPWFGAGHQRCRVAPRFHRVEVRYSAVADQVVTDARGRRRQVKVFIEGRGTQMVSWTAEEGHRHFLHEVKM